jgi:UDP:flavonoid glycosyltransferase YjiC (YdhE family)
VQGAISVALRWLGRLVMGPAVRRLANELGAPPIADIVAAADLNLGVWPEWFRRPAPDDPPRSHLCGFVFDPVDLAPPLPREVETFHAAGEAPVIAGFGSAASLNATERYRAVAAACDKLGRRCLLIGASADGVAANGRTMSVRAAPYARVFPAASMIVHHGGFGTCAEALRAGRPSLVTPFAFDQFDTAARVGGASLGRGLSGDPTRADNVAAGIDSIARSPALSASAREAAARIAAAPDGADRAAALVLELCARQRP